MTDRLDAGSGTASWSVTPVSTLVGVEVLGIVALRSLRKEVDSARDQSLGNREITEGKDYHTQIAMNELMCTEKSSTEWTDRSRR